MSQNEAGTDLKYQVNPDIKVYEKFLRRDGKDRLREWVYYAATQIPNYACLCAAGYAIGQQVGGTNSLPGIIAAMSIGVIIGPISALVEFDKSVHKSLADEKLKSWDCVLTESSWQCTDNDGVTTVFPWRLMKIVKTDPDYWEIYCRNHWVLVYRQALREAGLEEEFERRVGKEPAYHEGGSA